MGGRKFHVRAYVLCVGSLAVHCYSEALALFAGEPYDRCALRCVYIYTAPTARVAFIDGVRRGCSYSHS